MATTKTALIIGANRGIGLMFVKTLMARGWSVVGSVRPETRDDESVRELESTGAKVVQIDYKKEDTIMEAAQELSDTKLDLLINVAGIAVQPPSWLNHNKVGLMERFEVMTVGPYLAIKYFLPHILRDGGGKIASVSSSSGSIAGNDDERFVGYKMAKAALNQLTVTLANDFKKNNHPIANVALQPGYVKTKLTGFKGNIDINESVQGMVAVIDKLTVEDSPSFYSWKGERLPW